MIDAHSPQPRFPSKTIHVYFAQAPIPSTQIPSPQQNFHTNSQFRFGFTSDSSVNDIGLWMDDIVIVYDQQLTQNEYGIDSDIWSVTSFNELARDGMETERYNLLNPDEKNKASYVEQCLGQSNSPVLAASDYMRSHSEQIRPFVKNSFYSLGTDGFGRSDTRKNLRKFFEVDKEHIVTYALSVLSNEQLISSKPVKDAIKKYNIDTKRSFPSKL